MLSAGNWPIIDDGEKVGKCPKCRQCVQSRPKSVRQSVVPGRSPAVSHEALPTFQKLKNSVDGSGDFILEVNLADTSTIIQKTLFCRPMCRSILDISPTNRRNCPRFYQKMVGIPSPAHRSGYVTLALTVE